VLARPRISWTGKITAAIIETPSSPSWFATPSFLAASLAPLPSDQKLLAFGQENSTALSALMHTLYRGLVSRGHFDGVEESSYDLGKRND
jgi:hypothetical protein